MWARETLREEMDEGLAELLGQLRICQVAEVHLAMCEAQRSGRMWHQQCFVAGVKGEKKMQCEAKKVAWLLTDF